MWRGKANRMEYAATHRAIIQIQSAIRMRLQMDEYQNYRDSITTMQAAARRLIVRVEAARWHAAVSEMQRMWRGKAARTKFASAARGILLIQTAYRAHQSVRNYLRCRSGFILLQSSARGVKVRREVSSWNAAAVDIQRCWRGKAGQTVFKRKKESIVKLQAIARCRRIRNNYLRNNAAIEIQSVWVGYVARCAFSTAIAQVVKLQSFSRGSSARAKYKTAKESAVKIQSVVRGMKGRRAAALVDKLARWTKAATKIQALARGRAGRRQRALRAKWVAQMNMVSPQNRDMAEKDPSNHLTVKKNPVVSVAAPQSFSADYIRKMVLQDVGVKQARGTGQVGFAKAVTSPSKQRRAVSQPSALTQASLSADQIRRMVLTDLAHTINGENTCPNTPKKAMRAKGGHTSEASMASSAHSVKSELAALSSSLRAPSVNFPARKPEYAPSSVSSSMRDSESSVSEGGSSCLEELIALKSKMKTSEKKGAQSRTAPSYVMPVTDALSNRKEIDASSKAVLNSLKALKEGLK
mmetsp:Transcript_25835/g.76350  ORF Transcript_25835/g.76350 Transcript_25835/m.76350 type:complete len:524 (-) Transcript_25835:407-1978(-)